MKRFLVIFLAAIICLSATACTNHAGNSPEQTEDKVSATSKEVITTTATTTDTAESTETPSETSDTGITAVEPGIGGGFDKYAYIAPYSLDYYKYNSYFGELADDQGELKKWRKDAYDHAMYLLKELGDREAYNKFCISTDISSPTVESFIKKFSVPKEEFLQKNSEMGEYAQYTEAQVDALFSGDRDLIDEQFINPCAIKAGGVIYTPEWIETHTLEEIKAVGITKEMLADRYDDYLYYLGEKSEHTIDLKNKIDGFDVPAE